MRFLSRLWGTAEARGDMALAVFVVALAALVQVEVERLPAPFFDPLGPAAVPRLLAQVLTVLAIALVARRAFLAPQPAVAAAGPPPAPLLACATVLVTVLYVLSMQLRWLGFLEATLLYLIGLGIVLGGAGRRLVVILTITALVVAIGFDLVFTRFFFIDLPRPRLIRV